MKTIKVPEKVLHSFVGEQEVKEKLIYRKFFYVTEVKCENGYLIYNNLTGEMLFLSDDDFFEFNACDRDSKFFSIYVKKWFYVPNDFSDILFCDQTTNALRNYTHTIKSNLPVTNYTILTTTECNARCFYCFEKGQKYVKMTEKTARDVADYIFSSCKMKKVSIRWFGGEPLCNFNAIDTISNQLKELSIEYNSTIVSNGYLFNEDIIEKCKNIWNVKEVQITLDGTEKIYNRVKAYIYNSSNPFSIVINNIMKLLKAGINVRIRLNHGEHNTEDLMKLINFLEKKFDGYHNKLRIYSRILFDYSIDLENSDNEEKYWQLQKQNKELTEYIISKGFGKKWGIEGLLKYYHCMADDDNAIVILPDGRLGKCEHFCDSEICGDIYERDLDKCKIAQFKEVEKFIEICDGCSLRPNCYRLKKCPDKNTICNEDFKNFCIENVKERMVNTYERWQKDSAR